MERNTRQRAAIRSAIEHAARPLSVREAHALARKALRGLGIATVYRAINDLVEDGALREVELPGAAVRYEMARAGHHHHFHCRRCDRVYEVEGCPGSLSHLTPRGFRMEGHDLTITGLCAGCVSRRTKR
jgi:Fur family ferric uptake transcriptional regulator